MHRVKFVLAYDGTNYFGFQRQAGQHSIQQTLEEALEKVLRERVVIHPAGRTDTGVHARAQVVHFDTASNIPEKNFPAAVNSKLPEDIRILSAAHVRHTFHARFNALGKRYSYTIYNDEIVPPLLRDTVYRFPYALDFSLMQKGTRVLEGKHDFRSFQGRANRQENTVRHVRKIALRRCGKEIRFIVEGDGFLSHMVRNLVGTLLLVGRKKLSIKDLEKILAGRDRRLAGPTVPGKGLILERVFYKLKR